MFEVVSTEGPLMDVRCVAWPLVPPLESERRLRIVAVAQDLKVLTASAAS